MTNLTRYLRHFAYARSISGAILLDNYLIGSVLEIVSGPVLLYLPRVLHDDYTRGNCRFLPGIVWEGFKRVA